jgi:hypothetical protein
MERLHKKTTLSCIFISWERFAFPKEGNMYLSFHLSQQSSIERKRGAVEGSGGSSLEIPYPRACLSPLKNIKFDIDIKTTTGLGKEKQEFASLY